MSDKPASNEERPCLHCLIADTIDDFYAEYGSQSGEKDTIDMDEIISALGKTVAAGPPVPILPAPTDCRTLDERNLEI